MLAMFLWYQIPCSTDRSVAITVFTAYFSGPWLHLPALMSPDLLHLRPETTAFGCGPRNPFQLHPAPSVPCWSNSGGSVRTSFFLRDGYNEWLGGQGCNEGPEVIASGISQFCLEKNNETLNLGWCFWPWKAPEKPQLFSLSFDVVTSSAVICFSWLTVPDPFSFLCRSCHVSKYSATRWARLAACQLFCGNTRRRSLNEKWK